MIINIEREMLAIVSGLPSGARANGPALLALIKPGVPCPPLDRRLLYYTETYEELIFGLEWELAGPAPPESEVDLAIEWTADAFVDHGGRWEPLVPPVRSILSDKGIWFPLSYDLRGARGVAVTLSVRPEALARIMDARIWALLVAGRSGAPGSRAPVCVPLACTEREATEEEIEGLAIRMHNAFARRSDSDGTMHEGPPWSECEYQDDWRRTAAGALAERDSVWRHLTRAVRGDK